MSIKHIDIETTANEFYKELEYHRQQLNKLVKSERTCLTNEEIVIESKKLDELIIRYIDKNNISTKQNNRI